MYEEEILKIYKDSKGRYGAPKIHKMLREERGHAISLKRVQRIMKKLNIKSIIIKNSDHSSKSKIEAKEKRFEKRFFNNYNKWKWVTDITSIFIHLKTDGAICFSFGSSYKENYLAKCFFKDYGYRKLAIKAVENAYITQKPKNTVILHSDLGSQYTSSKFDDYLNEHNKVFIPLAARDVPYDNACIELFMLH